MSKFNTVYSALYNDNCYPFDELGETITVADKPDDLVDANAALIVWGGADINPKLYGHEKSRTTYCYDARDNAEWALMQRAKEMGITIIGVCRGAQMLCALAGGFLLQDVHNHSGYHSVETSTGDMFTVNSIHHQMMAGLEKVDHELLVWSAKARSPQYIVGADELFQPPENWKEPEYVYFPTVKGHAIQWHPEMMDDACEATQFVLHEINAR